VKKKSVRPPTITKVSINYTYLDLLKDFRNLLFIFVPSKYTFVILLANLWLNNSYNFYELTFLLLHKFISWKKSCLLYWDFSDFNKISRTSSSTLSFKLVIKLLYSKIGDKFVDNNTYFIWNIYFFKKLNYSFIFKHYN